jgi:aldehyde dehydrogenase (NAD+)
MNDEVDWRSRFKEQLKAREGLILSVADRKKFLKEFRLSIQDHENEIITALQTDLGKTKFEILGSEIGLVLQEIRYVLKHLKRWLKPQRKYMPISHWPASATVRPEPYGLVLIISPWNYPIQLAFIPLIAAIAAGNSAHLKLSEKSTALNPVIAKIIAKALPSWLVTVSDVPAAQVKEKILDATAFDKIFFTGGSEGGKAIANYAAQSLTPVTLELGGKSPAIVDGTVNAALSAKRLVWAKMLNAGQSCIAPDFILVQENHTKNLLEALAAEFTRVLNSSEKPEMSMAHIVDTTKFDDLSRIKSFSEVYYTGDSQPEKKWFHPTILYPVSWTDEAMQSEIFGPILPVLTYRDEADLFAQLKRNPKPLALYLFSSNRVLEQKILDLVPFGAGGHNHALMQIATPNLPHGGIGPSGTGRSHGYYGFLEFCHLKSWHRTRKWPDIPLRYAPYGEKKLNLLKRILR